MSNVSIFNFNANKVRTAIINNQVWFCKKDVLTALNISYKSDINKSLDPNGIVNNSLVTATRGVQTLAFVNEPNLYRIIFKSRKAEARAFQDWVFNEVLPQIRKTGQYAVPKIDKSLSYVKKLDVIKQSLPSEVGAVLDEIVDKAKKQGYCVAHKGQGKVKLNMRLTPEGRLLNIGLEMMDKSERQNLNKTVELVKEIGAVKGRAQMLDKYEGTEKFLTVLNMYEKELRGHTIKALDKGECPPILPFICSYIHNSKSELM